MNLAQLFDDGMFKAAWDEGAWGSSGCSVLEMRMLGDALDA